MIESEFQAQRLDVLIASVIYMMTSYQKNNCPGLANCIAFHLEHLCSHPEASATIRKMCAAMRRQWRAATAGLSTLH